MSGVVPLGSRWPLSDYWKQERRDELSAGVVCTDLHGITELHFLRFPKSHILKLYCRLYVEIASIHLRGYKSFLNTEIICGEVREAGCCAPKGIGPGARRGVLWFLLCHSSPQRRPGGHEDISRRAVVFSIEHSP